MDGWIKVYTIWCDNMMWCRSSSWSYEQYHWHALKKFLYKKVEETRMSDMLSGASFFVLRKFFVHDSLACVRDVSEVRASKLKTTHSINSICCGFCCGTNAGLAENGGPKKNRHWKSRAGKWRTKSHAGLETTSPAWRTRSPVRLHESWQIGLTTLFESNQRNECMELKTAQLALSRV